MALVCIDDKYGFIDTTGKPVVPCIYDMLTDNFSGGLALVEYEDDMAGYIDKNGTQFWED